jgi:protein subunit release factor B
MAWPQDVTKKDLIIRFARGSGAGGQNRNKRDTACSITHIPTGISARSEDQRSQNQNKQTAFKRLADKLVPIMKAAAANRGIPVERQTLTIRHYRESDQKVVDKRLNREFRYNDVIYKDGL